MISLLLAWSLLAGHKVPAPTPKATPRPFKFVSDDGTVVLDIPVVTGGMDAADVGKVLRLRFASIEACHDRSSPAVSASITVMASIDPQGKATGELDEENSSSTDPRLVQCVLSALGGAVFPAPKDGSEVTAMLSFVLLAKDAPPPPGASSIHLQDGAVVSGALDPAIIDAVVKRYYAQILNCYERELSVKPSLSGSLTVQFVIGADGQVTSAKAGAGSLDAEVSRCVTDRFLTMVFPRPKGGGVVAVTLPFAFSP